MKSLESLFNGDSLIAVNSSSSLLFRISDTYYADSHVCNFPGRSSSFYVAKDWLEVEFEKSPYKTRSEFKMSVDSYDLTCLTSVAPYGYEHEEMFIYATEAIKSFPRLTKEFNNVKVSSHKLYETEKVLRHTSSVIRATYLKKKNLLTTTLIKKKTFRICFFKETNQLVAYKGLKLTPMFCNANLPHDFKLRLLQIVEKKSPALSKILPTKFLFNDFSCYRKALLNPLWKDLNSKYALDAFTSTHLEYRKMLYAYKHKGTKQARHIVYGTSNKALIRFFETECKSPQIDCAKYIMKSFNIGPEKMLDLMQKDVKRQDALDSDFSNSSLWRVSVFENLLELHNKHGYVDLTVNRLIALCSTSKRHGFFVETELRDIIRSLHLLKNSGVPLTYPEFKAPYDLSLFSTQLGKMVSELRDKQFSVPFPHSEEAHKYYDHEDENFKFMFADNASLLRSCGNDMNICVGGYGNRARERHCDIVLVYKKTALDKPYSCLEVRKTTYRRSSSFFGSDSSPEHKLPYELQQAKLHRNNYAKTDEVLTQSILTWCKLKEIYPETRDIVDYDFSRRVQMQMTLQHPDPDHAPRIDNELAQLLDDLPF